MSRRPRKAQQLRREAHLILVDGICRLILSAEVRSEWKGGIADAAFFRVSFGDNFAKTNPLIGQGEGICRKSLNYT